MKTQLIIKQKKIKRYGWIPDAPDMRDLKFTAPHPRMVLPARVNLRSPPSWLPEIYDQGELGSCTANAIAGAFQYDQHKQGKADWIPSRLFIYYNERLIEGTIASDSGAAIRDGIKSVSKQGVCPESFWMYVEARFANKPPAECYTEALKNQCLVYKRLTGTEQICQSLASGFPVVVGFTVYESLETDVVTATGMIPLPKPDEDLLGGHAVLIVGYDKESKHFTIRNSWGPKWGDHGYGFLPFAYPLHDCWTMTSVEAA